jgi:hypothetical protein
MPKPSDLFASCIVMAAIGAAGSGRVASVACLDWIS